MRGSRASFPSGVAHRDAHTTHSIGVDDTPSRLQAQEAPINSKQKLRSEAEAEESRPKVEGSPTADASPQPSSMRAGAGQKADADRRRSLEAELKARAGVAASGSPPTDRAADASPRAKEPEQKI